jgi:hypothetical protein
VRGTLKDHAAVLARIVSDARFVAGSPKAAA